MGFIALRYTLEKVEIWVLTFLPPAVPVLDAVFSASVWILEFFKKIEFFPLTAIKIVVLLQCSI